MGICIHSRKVLPAWQAIHGANGIMFTWKSVSSQLFSTGLYKLFWWHGPTNRNVNRVAIGATDWIPAGIGTKSRSRSNGPLPGPPNQICCILFEIQPKTKFDLFLPCVKIPRNSRPLHGASACHPFDSNSYFTDRCHLDLCC